MPQLVADYVRGVGSQGTVGNRVHQNPAIWTVLFDNGESLRLPQHWLVGESDYTKLRPVRRRLRGTGYSDSMIHPVG